MTPAAILLSLALAASEAAPDPYADRVALRAADSACALFAPAERALLDALVALARDDAVRGGADPAALDRYEASAGAPDCDGPLTARLAEGHRAQIDRLAPLTEIAFPGRHQHWISERRRRGAPDWRVRQSTAEAEATLGLAPGEEEDRFVLAYRAEAAPAFAVIVFRDPARQAHPLDFTAGGLLPAPGGDPVSAWGGGARAEIRIPASGRLDPDTAARLAPAGGAPARGFVFPDRALRAMTHLTPRDGVRVEFTGADGRPAGAYWFETGMLNAALAVQGIALPEPERPEGTQTASR
ncbi:MAG: hypothetical protein ABL308_09120 [Oceanicaulis sp.]